MTNKKGFLTRDLVITAVLFTGIVGLMIMGLTSIGENYEDENLLILNKNISENYNKINELTDGIEIARSSTQSGEGLDFLGTFDVVFQSTFVVIRLVFLTLDLYGGMASSLTETFPFLDSTVIGLFGVIALAILTIIIVFIWISSISRGKV